jgi:serine/threonine protein kinase
VRNFDPDDHDSIGYGTLPYRAPEVLCECKASPQLRWAADIWSLGCIFMELLTRAPFIHQKDPRSQLLCWLRVLNEPDPSNLGKLMETHQCSTRFANFISSGRCKDLLAADHASGKDPTLAERLDAIATRLRSDSSTDEATATIKVVNELIPAMLVLDPAQRLPASELL